MALMFGGYSKVAAGTNKVRRGGYVIAILDETPVSSLHSSALSRSVVASMVPVAEGSKRTAWMEYFARSIQLAALKFKA